MKKRELKAPQTYSGILTTALPPYPLGLLATEEQKAAADAEIIEQLKQRWAALCKH